MASTVTGAEDNAENAMWAPKVAIGSKLPSFELKDQFGESWTQESTLGDHGTVFVLSRSTVW